MAPPRPLVWKAIGLDEVGRRYDIDQDLNAVLSDPVVTRDGDSGKVYRVEGDPEKVKKIVRSLEKRGANVAKGEMNQVRVDIRGLKLNYPFDDDLRRLVIKMAVACIAKTSAAINLRTASRSYLLDGVSSADAPVFIDIRQHRDLDHLRPKLGHLIYVRANPAGGHAFAIVQFFGGIQLYFGLETTSQSEISVLATHDPVSHAEVFQHASPLDYDPPPRETSVDIFNAGISAALEKIQSELQDLYGNQAPTGLAHSPLT